jgi:hypothetical protein
MAAVHLKLEEAERMWHRSFVPITPFEAGGVLVRCLFVT